MPNFTANYLEAVTSQIFTAAGTPTKDADLVAKELVTANLMGHDSHGVIRIPQYTTVVVKLCLANIGDYVI
ncbi:MAG: Ldh family oxidoreductase [Chloroflexota bacterium]